MVHFNALVLSKLYKKANCIPLLFGLSTNKKAWELDSPGFKQGARIKISLIDQTNVRPNFISLKTSKDHSKIRRKLNIPNKSYIIFL